ncbi:MAG: hypothetical protein K2H41_04940 [Acetatifactor sp.]|nr:hypothetical protein [Acetatifactor sp.]
MKKKIWTGILAMALALSIGSTNALAAEPQYSGCRGCYNADGTCVSFVDEDRDGICDNFSSGACRGGYGRGAGRQGGGRGGRGGCGGCRK